MGLVLSVPALLATRREDYSPALTALVCNLMALALAAVRMTIAFSHV